MLFRSYRAPDVAAQIRAAAAGARFSAAVDVVASRASLQILSDVFAPSAGVDGPPTRLALLAPVKDGDSVTNPRDSAMHLDFPEWLGALFADKAVVELLPIFTFRLHQDAFSRDYIMPILLPRLLDQGAIRPNAVRLLKEGSLLDRVREGIDLLSNNKISGEKVVVDLRE